jgi:hypothetical protein
MAFKAMPGEDRPNFADEIEICGPAKDREKQKQAKQCGANHATANAGPGRVIRLLQLAAHFFKHSGETYVNLKDRRVNLVEGDSAGQAHQKCHQHGGFNRLKPVLRRNSPQLLTRIAPSINPPHEVFDKAFDEGPRRCHSVRREYPEFFFLMNATVTVSSGSRRD